VDIRRCIWRNDEGVPECPRDRVEGTHLRRAESEENNEIRKQKETK
jgi:hypothetical protein